MVMVRKQIVRAATVLTFCAALAGVALATTPAGVLSGTVVARGSFQDPVDLTFKVDGGPSEVIHVKGAAQTVMQEIVLGPNGSTGWHSHPGPVVVVIKSGTMTFYDHTCVVRTYRAGEAFVDSGQGHVHIAKNLDQTQNLTLWATYFDVPAGAPFRIDAPDPGTCSF
jgi:quercetin dioxygenase-like cupin family protein